jgi:hypothetical protein
VRVRGVAAILGVALVLTVTGCGEANIDQPKFAAQLNKNLKGRGVSSAEVNCITGQVYKQMSQKEVNTLFKAAKESQVPDSVMSKFNTIAKGCVSAQ